MVLRKKIPREIKILLLSSLAFTAISGYTQHQLSKPLASSIVYADDNTEDGVHKHNIYVTKQNFLDFFSMNGLSGTAQDKTYIPSYSSTSGDVILSPDEEYHVGSVLLKAKIDMAHDFKLTGYVNLGTKSDYFNDNGKTLNEIKQSYLNKGYSDNDAWYHANLDFQKLLGADGIGFAFHPGKVTDIGLDGNNFGIGGLSNAYGFKIDTWHDGNWPNGNPDAPDKSGRFGWPDEPNVSPYGSIFNTNDTGHGYIKDVKGMDHSQLLDGKNHKLIFDYDGSSKTLTITLYQKSDGTEPLVWTQHINSNAESMAMSITGSTGIYSNLQKFTIDSFNFYHRIDPFVKVRSGTATEKVNPDVTKDGDGSQDQKYFTTGDEINTVVSSKAYQENDKVSSGYLFQYGLYADVLEGMDYKSAKLYALKSDGSEVEIPSTITVQSGINIDTGYWGHRKGARVRLDVAKSTLSDYNSEYNKEDTVGIVARVKSTVNSSAQLGKNTYPVEGGQMINDQIRAKDYDSASIWRLVGPDLNIVAANNFTLSKSATSIQGPWDEDHSMNELDTTPSWGTSNSTAFYNGEPGSYRVSRTMPFRPRIPDNILNEKATGSQIKRWEYSKGLTFSVPVDNAMKVNMSTVHVYVEFGGSGILPAKVSRQGNNIIATVAPEDLNKITDNNTVLVTMRFGYDVSINKSDTATRTFVSNPSSDADAEVGGFKKTNTITNYFANDGVRHNIWGSDTKGDGSSGHQANYASTTVNDIVSYRTDHYLGDVTGKYPSVAWPRMTYHQTIPNGQKFDHVIVKALYGGKIARGTILMDSRNSNRSEFDYNLSGQNVTVNAQKSILSDPANYGMNVEVIVFAKVTDVAMSDTVQAESNVSVDRAFDTATSWLSSTTNYRGKPIKQVFRHNSTSNVAGKSVQRGETVDYRITQKLGVVGKSPVQSSSDFVLKDTLDKDLIPADINDFKVLRGDGKDVTSSFNLNKAGQSVTASASSKFLADATNYQGNNYVLVIPAKVTRVDETTIPVNNKAQSIVNGNTQDSNTVTHYIPTEIPSVFGYTGYDSQHSFNAKAADPENSLGVINRTTSGVSAGGWYNSAAGWYGAPRTSNVQMVVAQTLGAPGLDTGYSYDKFGLTLPTYGQVYVRESLKVYSNGADVSDQFDIQLKSDGSASAYMKTSALQNSASYRGRRYYFVQTLKAMQTASRVKASPYTCYNIYDDQKQWYFDLNTGILNNSLAPVRIDVSRGMDGSNVNGINPYTIDSAAWADEKTHDIKAPSSKLDYPSEGYDVTVQANMSDAKHLYDNMTLNAKASSLDTLSQYQKIDPSSVKVTFVTDNSDHTKDFNVKISDDGQSISASANKDALMFAQRTPHNGAPGYKLTFHVKTSGSTTKTVQSNWYQNVVYNNTIDNNAYVNVQIPQIVKSWTNVSLRKSGQTDWQTTDLNLDQMDQKFDLKLDIKLPNNMDAKSASFDSYVSHSIYAAIAPIVNASDLNNASAYLMGDPSRSVGLSSVIPGQTKAMDGSSFIEKSLSKSVRDVLLPYALYSGTNGNTSKRIARPVGLSVSDVNDTSSKPTVTVEFKNLSVAPSVYKTADQYNQYVDNGRVRIPVGGGWSSETGNVWNSVSDFSLNNSLDSQTAVTQSNVPGSVKLTNETLNSGYPHLNVILPKYTASQTNYIQTEQTNTQNQE